MSLKRGLPFEILVVGFECGGCTIGTRESSLDFDLGRQPLKLTNEDEWQPFPIKGFDHEGYNLRALRGEPLVSHAIAPRGLI
jgi:hypothetical protein